MFLQLDPTILYHIIIEHQLALDGIISHKLLTFLQVLNVFFIVIQQIIAIKLRYDICNAIVLLQDGRYGTFNVLVTIDQGDFFLKDLCPKVSDVLDLFLEIHELKSSQGLEISDGFAEPKFMQLLHGMKVIDGDKSVWMLSMILSASDAANLKGILAGLE